MLIGCRSAALVGVIGLCAAAALPASAQKPSASPAPTLRIDLGYGVALEMVLVKAGTFHQGSSPREKDRGDDESERDVTLSRDFYIGKYEVTVGQYRRFVASGGGYTTEAEKGRSGGSGWDGQALVQRPEFNWKNPGFPQTDAHPVTLVTYNDAIQFASWLTNTYHRAFNLPSEAEWEYAARGGSKSRFYAGDADAVASEIGWFKHNAGNGSHPVGQKKPNGFGLHDMAGNAAEWCRDWYAPYVPGPVTDPDEQRSTLSDKPRKVLRGGSWAREAKNGRSAARYRNTPPSRNADNGFRVVASIEAQAPPVTTPAAPRAAAGASAGSQQPLGFTPPQPSSRWLGLLGLLLVVPFVLLPAWIAWKIFGALFRKSGPQGIQAKLGTDGFTLRAPNVPVGHRIRYRYTSGLVSNTGEVVVSGDPAQGQFAYTGDRPSSVEILGVLTAAGIASGLSPQGKPVTTSAAAAAGPRRRSVGTYNNDDDDDSSSFRGYPSAY